MSQKHVERVIGRLVTDDAFRRLFAKDPDGVMQALQQLGFELTTYERRALRSIDLRAAVEFAGTIDPCLQKLTFREE